MRTRLIGYKLNCGHPIAAPTSLVNGTLWCPWHSDRFTIVDVLTEEWHAKCRRCNFGRWAGQSRNTADIFANGHMRHYRGHMVDLVYETNPEAQATKDKFDAWQLRAQPGTVVPTEMRVYNEPSIRVPPDRGNGQQ